MILSQDVRELDDVNHLRVTEVIEQEKRVVSVGGKEEEQWLAAAEVLGE